MPVNILCERCNTNITTVAALKVKEWVHTNGELCKKCQRMDDQLKEYYEKKRVTYEKKLNRILEEAQTDMKKKVIELAHGGQHDEDIRQLHQGSGNN